MLANGSQSLYRFADLYNQQFAIGQSPVDGGECIFFGTSLADIEIDDNRVHGRAHLTRAMVRDLLPLLHQFVDTGVLTPAALQRKKAEEKEGEEIRLVPRRKATLQPIDRYKPPSSGKSRKRDFHQFVFGVPPSADRNKRKFDAHIRDESASNKTAAAAGPLKVLRKRKISAAQSRALSLSL